eukprot:TRINITY_DN14742_c0_g1_i2.p1 TRINITY_DN14742_c0_g1~~TRINITY_DN14742_c0_g1_i2.p1  ORF type:complete len:353 (+),score=63.92 TRINITY_DN14742_c0_g1_i2:625-1683(+)
MDLWDTDRPAYGRTGSTYGDDMFTAHILGTIAHHDPTVPYFAYWAVQNNHEPLQVPERFADMFPQEWVWDRRTYQAMAAHWDQDVGKVADRLREKGMWEHTLWVQTADNGGPIYPSYSPDFPHCGGANNFPLRGGKTTNFEGGVRTAAFVTGGWLPAAVRGTKQEGYVHIADWFGTFCGLAGVDPTDTVPGLPGVDSIDVWPLVSGAVQQSPRREIPLCINGTWGDGTTTWPVSALISGDMKVMSGQYNISMHQGPDFPNASKCCEIECWRKLPTLYCGTFEHPTCLYNITADPGEERNLADALPDLLVELAARMHELSKDGYYPDRSESQETKMRATAHTKYHGFKGPWLP